MSEMRKTEQLELSDEQLAAAGKVLAKAALLDPRMSVDKGTILAWAEILAPAGLDAGDLMASLTLHYSTSTERIMPAELLRLARARRNDRVNRDRGNDTAPPMPQLPPATVEARREAIAAAAAKIGNTHAVDTRATFETAPKPKLRPSQATIAQRVAKVRASAPPADMALDDEHLAVKYGLDAQVVMCTYVDEDDRACRLAQDHIGPHHLGDTAADPKRQGGAL